MMKTTRALSNNEHGQAIVEMCAGLIGIMVVFTAILFISTLGSENIRTLITARENADAGSGGIAPSNIDDWDYGEDQIIFSGDDSFTNGVAADSTLFSGQLGFNGAININADARTSGHNLVTGAQEVNIFLDASQIEGAQGNRLDTTLNLFNSTPMLMMDALQTLFGVNDIDLAGERSNQVFMPQALNAAENANGNPGGGAEDNDIHIR